MMIELLLGLGLAAIAAGVAVKAENIREARVLDNAQFESKLNRLASDIDHRCEHCGNVVSLTDIRLLFADDKGQIRVVCDRDECLLAHTQGQSASLAHTATC